MRDRWLAVLGTVLAVTAAAAEIPIHGRLTGADGGGVAGAPVVLLPLAGGQPAAQARTGRDGGFVLRAPAAGMWGVEVRPPDALPRRLRLEPLTGQTVLPAVTAAPEPAVADPGDPLYPETWRDISGRRLYPAGPSRPELLRETYWRRAPEPVAGPDDGRAVELTEITGRVVDAESGKALAGALVWQGGRPGGAVPADAGGRYRVRFDPQGEALLRAWTEGYRGGHVGVELSAGDERALALEPATTLRGRLAGEDGGTVAAAEVYVDLGNHVQIVDAQDGWFYLDRLAPGAGVQLHVLADGYAAAPATVRAPERFAARTDFDVVLPRGSKGKGRVVDASGNPVAGARVIVTLQNSERRSYSLPPVLAGEARSDAAGRFELRHLPSGHPDLAVEAAGYARLEVPGVEVPPDHEPLDLGVLVLEAGAAISGRVVSPTGEGVAAAAVFFADGHRTAAGRGETPRPVAVSGEDGSFVIADLRRGTHRDLRIEAPGCSPRLLSKVVAPTNQLVAVLRPGARISGRVVDEEGRPVTAAYLAVAAEEPEQTWEGPRRTLLRSDVRPDAEGGFVIDGLEPRPVDLFAHAPGFVSARRHLTLAAGEEIGGLEIVVERGGVITGKVLEADGRPALVNVVAASHWTQTDAEGRFRIAGVPFGAVNVHAYKQSGESAEVMVQVEPGENPVEIRPSHES